MRRWDRKIAKAFGLLWVPNCDGEILSVAGVHKAYFQPGLVTLVDHVTQFTAAMRRQFENGCMPKQMMTGSESGESYAQTVASGVPPRFMMIDDPVTEPYSPEAVARALK